jgi:predicted permease
VSLEAASHRLATAQDARTAVYPDYRGAWAESLMDSVVGDVRSTLWFLLSAVGLTLIVATVNVANILTASGLSRRREMAIRIALGAGSGRLARGLLVETAVIALLGGLGGVLVAWLGLPLLLRMLPPGLPRHESLEMSTGVLFFGLTITGVTALLVGTVPALLAARTDPQDTLRSTAQTISGARASATARGALVLIEVALAFVLLVGAALLGNSYLRLWSMERGFDTRGLVAMRVAPDRAMYRTEEESDLFVEMAAARLGEVSGVRATAVNNLPLSGQRSGTRVYLERPGVELEMVDDALLTVVLGNYLDVVGIPVVAGRRFESSDRRGTPPVAIVSETLARRFLPGGNVIGRRLRISDDSTTSVEIVGVAADVRHEGLAAAVAPTVYLPASQSRRETYEMVLHVRGDIARGIQSARAVVARLSPTTPVGRVLVLDEAIADSVAIPRFRTVMVVALAGLAAVISLLGLYGVVAFAMAQRTREIGVRMALGARPRSILLWAVAGGVGLGGAGVALGLLMAWIASDLMAAFLFEIVPTDPATYLGVTISVLAVCIAATAVPARRAATVDPVRVLKSE